MAQQNVQETIVRQSQLKLASEYYQQVGYKPTLKELVALSNIMAEYCLNGYTKELGTKLGQVDKILKIK